MKMREYSKTSAGSRFDFESQEYQSMVIGKWRNRGRWLCLGGYIDKCDNLGVLEGCLYREKECWFILFICLVGRGLTGLDLFLLFWILIFGQGMNGRLVLLRI